MIYKADEIVNGFKVKRIREVEELQGILYEFEHIKTKTQLVWLDNKEKNKFFSIAFKTVPEDSTGVFHILEHSVLNGSKKYPVKEPFVDLLKGSMKTFLNAMTFPDKTIYPVSSCNEKDFQNLVSVYLDAVFAPEIYRNPNIFYQEGWHYEMRNAKDAPIYKGVVFNEMKGAYSSSQTVIMSELQSMIFQDNGYRFSSGGDPKSIPDLTYEKFVDTHKKFYHPSNAKIYLEGDMNLEKILEMISVGYLNDQEYDEFEPWLPMQKVLESREKEINYEISEQEDEADKTQLAFGKIVGDFQDYKRILAVEILCNYLADSIESPLKGAMIRSGLVQELSLMVYSGIMQPYLYGHIYNFKAENKDAVMELLMKTLEQIIEDGLNKDELNAIMNQMEFSMKEGQEPKGLINAIQSMYAWNFGGDPLTYMVCTEVFNDLRESLNDGYFENVYREAFCNWNHMSSVLAHPSKTIGQEEMQRERDKLENAKNSWNKNEIEEIIEKNNLLDQWQQTVDTPENLQKLPKITLDDVEKASELRQTEVIIEEDAKVLFHEKNTNGIVYLNVYYDLGTPEEVLLPALGFIPNMLTNLPTENYSVSELKRIIKRDIGNISFDIRAISKINEPEKSKLYLICNCSVLEEKIENAYHILQEILLRTKWETVDNIVSIWGQCTQYFMQDIIMNGQKYSMRIAESKFSMESYLSEHVLGISCFKWLNEMMLNPIENAVIYKEKVKPILDAALCKKNMIVGMTSSQKASISKLVKDFSIGKNMDEEYILPQCQNMMKSVLQIPAGISYGIRSMNLKALDIEKAGKFHVLAKIVSLDFLWNEIRVKGGAYGSGLKYSNDGSLSFYSYRDPDAVRSINIYPDTAKYIRSFCSKNEEIEKFIIGTLSDYEELKSTKRWGQVCDEDYLRGITADMRKKEKQQILECTKEDLLSCCDILEKLDTIGTTFVMGHEEIAKRCEAEGFKVESLMER